MNLIHMWLVSDDFFSPFSGQSNNLWVVSMDTPYEEARCQTPEDK